MTTLTKLALIIGTGLSLYHTPPLGVLMCVILGGYLYVDQVTP